MKPLREVCVAAAVVPWAMTTAAASCALPGQAVQWIADDCMQQLQTDDVEAASDCIHRELARKGRPHGDCAAAHHYKRAMCKRAVAHGTHAGPLHQCLADPAFLVNTVRSLSTAPGDAQPK